MYHPLQGVYNVWLPCALWLEHYPQGWSHLFLHQTLDASCYLAPLTFRGKLWTHCSRSHCSALPWLWTDRALWQLRLKQHNGNCSLHCNSVLSNSTPVGDSLAVFDFPFSVDVFPSLPLPFPREYPFSFYCYVRLRTACGAGAIITMVMSGGAEERSLGRRKATVQWWPPEN